MRIGDAPILPCTPNSSNSRDGRRLAMPTREEQKMKRQTRITFETNRLTVITSRRSLLAPCALCGAAAPMIGVEEAAAMARVNLLAVYRLIETGTLHCTETSAGRVLVCAASLANLISNQKG